MNGLMFVAVEERRDVVLVLSLALALAWLSSPGCAARQGGSYRIVEQVKRPILVPPGPALSSISPRRFTLRIPAGRVGCELHESGVKVEKRGSTLHVSIQEHAIAAGPPGWLTRWIDTLSDNGCLSRSQARSFTRRVMESVPLHLAHTYNVAFGRTRTAGFIDFHPGHKLKLVGPVFREGAVAGQSAIESVAAPQADEVAGLQIEARASADLIGYEESWYAVRSKRDGSLQLTHDRTMFFRDGEATLRDVPDRTGFDLVPASQYIRMVYLTRVADSGDHDVLFLVAGTRGELEARFAAIQEDPAQCLAADSREWCRVGPNELALNLYVSVSLNGVERHVAPGSSLIGLLAETVNGRVIDTPQDLQVLRPYGDRLARIKFDRSSPAILSLPLLGGERVYVPSLQHE